MYLPVPQSLCWIPQVSLPHPLFSRLLRSVREGQFLYLWKATFYTAGTFCPGHWALTLLLFKRTENLPLVLTEVFGTECLKKNIPSFPSKSVMYISLFTWNCSFLIYLLLSFSELNSVSPAVSFLRLLIYILLVCHSLFMELARSI